MERTRLRREMYDRVQLAPIPDGMQRDARILTPQQLAARVTALPPGLRRVMRICAVVDAALMENMPQEEGGAREEPATQ